MIRVTRTTKPTILSDSEEAWKDAISSASTYIARIKAQDKYKHPKIKEELVKMFHGKCAYCESAITHIDYGHIEHFKPKSLPAYYTLAVDWDNLLLACGRCNGSENKGAKFPNAAEGGPLINPVEEDPSQHLCFDFDRELKLANVLGVSERGETTKNICGLNRPPLLNHRSKFVTKLWVRGGPAKRSQCLSYGAEGLEGLEYHLNHETKKTDTQCGVQGACCLGSHQGYQDNQPDCSG